jgi:hypothetical protein
MVRRRVMKTKNGQNRKRKYGKSFATRKPEVDNEAARSKPKLGKPSTEESSSRCFSGLCYRGNQSEIRL